MTALLATIVAFVAGGGLLHLLMDGLKTGATVIDRTSDRNKKLLLLALAVLCIVVVRGFSFPDTLFGWLYFVGEIAVLFFLAQGWYRYTRRAAGLTTSPRSIR